MKIITHDIMPEACVLTIGKFESFHRGHQALIHHVIEHAKKMELPSAVMIFDPNPNSYFNPEYKPMLTARERAGMINDLGIDYLILQRFDETFMNMQPGDFNAHIFIQLKAQCVIVGNGFHFGKNRSGDIHLLSEGAKRLGAEVIVFEPKTEASTIFAPVVYTTDVHHEHEKKVQKISTSAIRHALMRADVETVNDLLGYNYFIKGKTAQGDQQGRQMGTPTLNFYPDAHKLLPPNGVYASCVFIDDLPHLSITNIGTSPTMRSENTQRVETHILNVTVPPMYDTDIEVELLEFIRPEQKFASQDALMAQISKDIQYVKNTYHGM